ncbi:MAG: UDP-glucose/GDP-mannose dehydrogenase family protein [Candidatus Dormibacteraeota bacterium]|uniref:UDP-glucose 6-dehydrogenase n=1 Tax=Candidatus Aeolococcus gillhamiae TaxID=3127015 RepID=A0A934K1Q6_9BACT|nr:UDP-glucose/GDP-mannose dehydrogenase family protein [Candidatus Dormibacteraeota bacterium]
MSRIAVVGMGYVGLTTASCLADLGNDVFGLDVDVKKTRRLQDSKAPFYEPDLQELLTRNAVAGRLRFTSNYAEAIPSAEFVFIAVGTPMDSTGAADLDNVRAASAAIAPHLRSHAVIVNKSTVPIGTGDIVSEIVRSATGNPAFALVSNPEFLREGSAILDFMHPDRVVLGARGREAASRVGELYAPLGAPVLVTTLQTAEMIKYACNAFLATKISFINEVARLCERVGADVKVVAEGMGMDSRIGASFLDAGLGYGGSCFPKDVSALARSAEQSGAQPQLLHAVMDINNGQPQLVVEKLSNLLGTVRGCTIGLLGLSFKPNTDDMREAPSIALVRTLQERGALVRAYDPAAMESARVNLPDVVLCEDAYEVAEGCDGLIVVTEWNEFRQLNMPRIKGVMRRPVIVDGRNMYSPDELRALGFSYAGVGR